MKSLHTVTLLSVVCCKVVWFVAFPLPVHNRMLLMAIRSKEQDVAADQGFFRILRMFM
jgi:hypothetical protein